MLIHNLLDVDHVGEGARCQLLVKAVAMAGQQDKHLTCLWQDEGHQSHVGNIMLGKAGRVVGKEMNWKFRRCIGMVMIVARIFAQLRVREAVTFVTSEVAGWESGEWEIR